MGEKEKRLWNEGEIRSIEEVEEEEEKEVGKRKEEEGELLTPEVLVRKKQNKIKTK